MSRKEAKPFRTVSWQDVLIGAIFSWFVKKIFDFLWERARVRLQFEGKMNPSIYFRYLLWDTFGEVLLFLETLVSIRLVENEDELRIEVRHLLQSHAIYHLLCRKGNKPCRYCGVVVKNRRLWEKLVSNAMYYPPYPPVYANSDLRFKLFMDLWSQHGKVNRT